MDKLRLEMTEQQLVEIRLLANAAFAGGLPCNIEAFAVPADRMNVLRQVLKENGYPPDWAVKTLRRKTLRRAPRPQEVA